MKKLTEKFNLISVRKGDLFTVALQENGSTGYLWDISVTKGQATQVARETTVGMQDDGQAVGAGYTLRTVWQAQSDGVIELKAELKRPWETGKPAVKAHKFTVISS